MSLLVRVLLRLIMLSIFFLFKEKQVFIEIELIHLYGERILIVFFFDWMSISFIFIVSLISSIILCYRKYYMEGEIFFYRFVIILLLFVFRIWLFILRPNIIRLLLGWDGLGLRSYLLVIYYQRDSSNNAGILTILSNRVGDVCLLLGLSLMFFLGSWNFIFLKEHLRIFIRLIFILAGITKRAQLPFRAWLPAAIAAPTPVSALVHSSTLVTAGVYLIIRFFDSLDMQARGFFLFVISVRTIFMAGLCANFEIDIKKIIALSTLSQLGLIIMELRIGYPILCYCHLVTHAIFKSTIFICAGVVIHMRKKRQDIRCLGGLRNSSPFLNVFFSVTNLALCGYPFLAGYYSKDIILERIFISRKRLFITFIIVVSTGFTISYSLRVLFIRNRLGTKTWVVNSREELHNNLSIILGIIFLLSIVGGYFVLGWMDWICGFWLLGNIQKFYVLAVRFFFIIVRRIILKKRSFWIRRLVSHIKGLRRMWFCLLVVRKLNIILRGYIGWVRIYILDKGWYELFGGRGGKRIGVKIRGFLQKRQNSFFVRGYLLTRFFFLFLIGFIFCLNSLWECYIEAIKDYIKQGLYLGSGRNWLWFSFLFLNINYFCFEKAICFLHYKNG